MRTIGNGPHFYNHQRPNQALKIISPAEAHALATRPAQEPPDHYMTFIPTSSVAIEHGSRWSTEVRAVQMHTSESPFASYQ